jgi:Kdo2-lipid IVA lauroyltransferase/acyltransferase
LLSLIVNLFVYYFVNGLIALVRALPLDVVARAGRFLGGLAYFLDGRHRRVACRNLTMCFGKEMSPAEIRALACENFKRIGENFLCPVKMFSLEPTRLWERLEIVGGEKLVAHEKADPSASIILALGHFGNFEMLAHLGRDLPGHQTATTYRAMKNPALNALLIKLRARTGCLYFERRTGGADLRAALRSDHILLGLLADQNSLNHSVRLPFLGHECNTSKAPAVFALRFNAPLHVVICYRTRLAHWRMEVSGEVPTHENGSPRPVAAIMLDVNRAFEAAVRRDPANWFWVHKRWKNSKRQSAATDAAQNQEPDVAVGEDRATASSQEH